MLNVFRENLRHLKWILWLVAATFVLFFGAAWWEGCGTQTAGPWVATVNGEQVSFGRWQEHARQLEQQYRRMFGEQFEQVRESINAPRRSVEQLVDERLVVQDARRMGLSVPAEELRATIVSIPALQRDGAFIGAEQYRQAIRKGLFGRGIRSEAEFEQLLTDALLQEKWEHVLASSIVITPEEIEREFRRRNEKAKLEYVALRKSDFAEDIAPSDEELAAWYEARRDRWQLDEARRATFVLLDDEAVSDRIEIGEEEVRAFYEENQQLYARSEERRARQILIRVAPEAPAAEVEAAREKAQQAAERARGGEDFAALAEELSDDQMSAAQGGDLGFFQRGVMVPEFEDAVFTLEPGVVSEPVRTDFGFHVIRVEEIRQPGPQPLEEVEEQIRGRLRFEQLAETTRELADELVAKARAEQSLRAAAEALGLSTSDSGIIGRDEPVPGVGPAPALSGALFEAEEGAIADPVSLPQGRVVFTVDELLEDHLPPLEARRAEVLAAYRTEESVKRAREALDEAVTNEGGDLVRVASRLDTERYETEAFWSRGQALAGIGTAQALERAVFAAAPSDLIGPLASGEFVVVARVLERQEADLSKLADERELIERTLRQPRIQSVITARKQALRDEADIRRNPVLLEPRAES